MSGFITRRDLFKSAAVATLAQTEEAFAGPFTRQEFDSLVPHDKKLSRKWLQSLTARGERDRYTGGDLRYIGMPVGGIACGQLYLGGNGRLWYWDIFRSVTTTDYGGKIWAGLNYEKPLTPKREVEHGFTVEWTQDGNVHSHTLDDKGFQSVTFRGEYPIGRVTFADPKVPFTVHLEAYSPFIPLNVADSSIPATILSYRVESHHNQPLVVTIRGHIENPVCRYGDGGIGVIRSNRVIVGNRMARLECNARVPSIRATGQPDILHVNFEGPNWGEWKSEGTAFGDRPYRDDERRFYTALQGFEAHGFANSHMMRNGEDAGSADAHRGKLIGPNFTIERNFISFRIGGGKRPGKLGLHLIVDGKIVRQATGLDSGVMRADRFDVRDLKGKGAHLEIIDDADGGWGHTTVDDIFFTDNAAFKSLEDIPGYGSLTLTAMGPIAFGAGRVGTNEIASDASLSGGGLIGEVGSIQTIKPNASQTFNFVLTWWFPYYNDLVGEMAAIDDIKTLTRQYAVRFESATAVAEYVTDNFKRLSEATLLWNRTWYDSTLPYWLLDRTFIAVDSLATQTMHAFSNGRWWGWEGVDCCPGTCQHVWHYAQSVARIFPEIERSLRERVDFGHAWKPTGEMGFRAENDTNVAHDGFCGTIIRVWREHTMSPNSAFLKRLWPRVRTSLAFMMNQDQDKDGLLEGVQMNTLDAEWHGPMAWISSVFLAAIAAGEAMAKEMGDDATAAACRARLAVGRRSLVEKLFDGEYFIHKPGDFNRTNTNKGCHSDQLLGQSLAMQAGLPRVAPVRESHSALAALWKYNFTLDAGAYRTKFKQIEGGRWYAMPGEAGLLVCTWPKGGSDKAAGNKQSSNFVGYFNEIWTGFEHQVASHMIWEGLVTEGLSIERAIHDRYHPHKRNPYNEIECSDHYARAMSAYGVFVAVCGFEHHGPSGHIAFAPRVTPDDFRAPFTSAAGWGTFSQRRNSQRMTASIDVKWGKLQVKSFSLQLREGAVLGNTTVKIAGKEVAATSSKSGSTVTITLVRSLVVSPDKSLIVEIS